MEKTGQDSIKFGEVVSIDDPTFSGRIKVRVAGMHDNIPVEQLPWCTYGGSNIFSGKGGGSISIARVGQKVRVQFKSDENTSMEWFAINSLDLDLINEIKSDYEGSHVLLYDSSKDISIKYQPTTGIIIYYAGSYIQMSPDNNITIHYGLGATGTQIQLSEGRVDIQGGHEINLSTSGSINLEADNIRLNAKSSIEMSGTSAAECAVNGTQLMTLLQMLAGAIDAKVPQTAGITGATVNSLKAAVLNQKIKYTK